VYDDPPDYHPSEPKRAIPARFGRLYVDLHVPRYEKMMVYEAVESPIIDEIYLFLAPVSCIYWAIVRMGCVGGIGGREIFDDSMAHLLTMDPFGRPGYASKGDLLWKQFQHAQKRHRSKRSWKKDSLFEKPSVCSARIEWIFGSIEVIRRYLAWKAVDLRASG
jgi:hypothetical protein